MPGYLGWFPWLVPLVGLIGLFPGFAAPPTYVVNRTLSSSALGYGIMTAPNFAARPTRGILI